MNAPVTLTGLTGGALHADDATRGVRITGLPAALAHRSQAAFTTAPVARCMAPLSGPIQRSWLSEVTWRQNAPMSAAMVSSSQPTSRWRIASIAAQQISLPRPMVKVRPWPFSDGTSASRMT